ncbi:MAG: tetratricopeptide repeat protein [Candidatus Saccharimonadaceae bacterium]
MSQQCPLCGKNKADKSLFCTNCTVKLNSEYEVNVPIKGDSETVLSANDEIIEHQDEDVTPNDEKPIPPHDNIKQESKRQDSKRSENVVVDNRTDDQKSYYEIARDKPRKNTHFTLVSLFIVVLVLGAAYFIYKEFVIDRNLERSNWEVAQRENSINSYLDYMDEYPQGVYVMEAQQNMLSLKGNESEAWQNLNSSENTVEFTDFLQRYPDSPYERKARNRLDSLMWQSSMKDNSVQAFTDYLNLSASGEITGQYIGEAQKRFNMLNQTTPIDEVELANIKETVNGFFAGLSNVSHTELNIYLAPVISRFHNVANIPNEKMIGELLLLAAKSDAKSIKFDPEITKLKYEKIGSYTYTVNVPLQKYFVGNNGTTNQIKGYIVHLKLDPKYRIYSYHETKPFSEAP